MKFDAQKYAYPSRRSVTFAKNGMVATSCPLRPRWAWRR